MMNVELMRSFHCSPYPQRASCPDFLEKYKNFAFEWPLFFSVVPDDYLSTLPGQYACFGPGGGGAAAGGAHRFYIEGNRTCVSKRKNMFFGLALHQLFKIVLTAVFPLYSGSVPLGQFQGLKLTRHHREHSQPEKSANTRKWNH